MTSIHFCNIIGIGHPRTGTGYTSKLLTSWGLAVGHEEIKTDGIVAWQLIKKQGPYPYAKDIFERPKYEYLIYNVRNPFDSLPSIVYTEDIKSPSFNFRRNECQIPLNEKNPIDNAIISLTYFDTLVEKMRPDFVFRVEDQYKELFEFLQKKGLKVKATKISKKKFNKRKHSDFDTMISEFGDISNKCKKLFNNYCVKHGYINHL